MYLIIPYKSIFEVNKWFYDTTIKSFIYSDESVIINTIYLTIPFKNDKDYNRKLLTHFKRFLLNLSAKIPNSHNKKSFHRIELYENDITPLTIKLTDILYSDQQVLILWERTDKLKNCNNINHQ